MTNITLDGLPAKTGTIFDAGIIHYREGGVDKKVTVADFLIRISEEYSSDINTFLAAADKAAGRAALGIARRTAVSNADYTILVTDKVVAQIGTMSAARTFTLPTAALYPAGEELIIVDQSGSVTSSNKIIISRSSADTIDGATSKELTTAYGFLRLISDGISKWKVANAFQATDTLLGTAKIATQLETDTGTDDLTIVTPLKLKNNLITKRFTSSEQVITIGGGLTIPHGLGVRPTLVTTNLICKVADQGYSIGDVIDIALTESNPSGSYGSTITLDSTNLFVRYGSISPVYYVNNKSTGNVAPITIASWKTIFTAWSI